MDKGICIAEDCARQAVARQRCRRCYGRAARTGTLRLKFNEVAFWSKVEKTDGCWNWTAFLDQHGYGVFGARGVPAHRLAYELLIGPIAPGLNIDHRCFNRRCVNPEHLRPVTHKQNGEHRALRERPVPRGVYWHKKRRRWVAEVVHHGRGVHGGYFKNMDDAEAAAIALRNRLYTHNDLDRRESA